MIGLGNKSPIIVQLKNISFVWVGRPDLGEEQVKKKGRNWKNYHFSMEIWGNCSNFAMEG